MALLAETPHSSLAPALTPLLSVEDVSELEPSDRAGESRAGRWLLPGLLQILFRASFIHKGMSSSPISASGKHKLHFFSTLIFLLLQRVFLLQVA